MKMIYKTQFFLHIFIGVGALSGGFAAIANPTAPMGIPIETLHGYFDSFLIPGLFLFIAIGLGNLACALLFKVKIPVQGYSSGFIGAVLLIWIIIQCVIMNDVVALHVIFGALGFLQGVLALITLADKKLFPMNILLNIFNKIFK